MTYDNDPGGLLRAPCEQCGEWSPFRPLCHRCKEARKRTGKETSELHNGKGRAYAEHKAANKSSGDTASAQKE